MHCHLGSLSLCLVISHLAGTPHEPQKQKCGIVLLWGRRVWGGGGGGGDLEEGKGMGVHQSPAIT